MAQYARKQTYRLAGYASFGGVSMHFVVIGFSTVYFVDRGMDLRLVAVLLAAGRILSAPVKIVGGALYDRRGGPWTARLMMASTSALGLPLLLLPARWGAWVLVPFVGMAVSVLPVANAMLVAALPPQSGWGIGTFRAALKTNSKQRAVRRRGGPPHWRPQRALRRPHRRPAHRPPVDRDQLNTNIKQSATPRVAKRL